MNNFHLPGSKPKSSGRYWVVNTFIEKEEKNGQRTRKYQDCGYAKWDGFHWDRTDWNAWYGEKQKEV